MVSQKFCYILGCASLCHIYYGTYGKIPAVAGSIVVDGMLTSALLHSVHDLKPAQKNMECSLIQEPHEVHYNTVVATKGFLVQKMKVQLITVQ